MNGDMDNRFHINSISNKRFEILRNPVITLLNIIYTKPGYQYVLTINGLIMA